LRWFERWDILDPIPEESDVVFEVAVIPETNIDLFEAVSAADKSVTSMYSTRCTTLRSLDIELAFISQFL
jgi:hypothetical protein